MLSESWRNSPGVQVQRNEAECGESAVTALIVTDTDGRGVLLKLCRRHLCRLVVNLIEELE